MNVYIRVINGKLLECSFSVRAVGARFSFLMSKAAGCHGSSLNNFAFNILFENEGHKNLSKRLRITFLFRQAASRDRGPWWIPRISELEIASMKILILINAAAAPKGFSRKQSRKMHSAHFNPDHIRGGGKLNRAT